MPAKIFEMGKRLLTLFPGKVDVERKSSCENLRAVYGDRHYIFNSPGNKRDLCIQRYIMARSGKYCCHGNTTIRPIFIARGVDVAVNNMCSLLLWKCNNELSLLCCRATKYIVQLLTIISVKYHECVSVFLS